MINSYNCPYCNGRMEPIKIKCQDCGVIIEGDFRTNALAGLSAEQLEFAITFLKHRGNLKDLEEIYNLSYPTLRNKLAEISDILNEKDSRLDEESENTPLSLLKSLEAGELDVGEVLDRLNSL